MDRSGVDRSLVIPFPVVEDHRAAHDEIAHAVRAHPGRLAGAACIYPYIPEQEFRTEVRRCREELGFGALKLQPQYHGLNAFSSRSDFFFEMELVLEQIAIAFLDLEAHLVEAIDEDTDYVLAGSGGCGRV